VDRLHGKSVPRRDIDVRRGLVIAALVLALAAPRASSAEEPAPRVLDWESGANKSYLIPALEIPAFIFALNQFNRHFLDDKDYETDWDSIWKNLRTAPEFDKDPFSVNQLGHPYQGSVYYGLARSAGLSYWESLLYTVYGSFLWETAGETTRPSINDHISTGIGGSFVGEALFRMSSLMLEGGGETPGFWRELGAAIISPPTGLNRLLFGERFRRVFPSHDPAIFVRFRLGATLTTNIDTGGLVNNPKRQEGNAEFYMTYGLPGKPGYQYKRPFDFFLFEFTAVPNASTAANAVENVTIRGLLVGDRYEWGEDYRGVWGLFGGYEYLSPQVFRLATTNFALGTVAQWWLTRTVALQGTALGGAGFGASGTVGDRDERDYRYGVVPHAILGLRLIFTDLAMLEAQGRQYWIVGVGSGASLSAEKFGHEVITRGNVALTVRAYGPHAISLSYLISTRDARLTGRDRHQSVGTVTLSYNFLGHRKFGAVDWRPGEIDR
jgi:hypothetical protein